MIVGSLDIDGGTGRCFYAEKETVEAGGRMKERVEQVINRIRPAVQIDGGDIELIEIVNGVVKLRLVGSCSGCPSSLMTLKMGIERAIRAEVPEVTSVEAIPT